MPSEYSLKAGLLRVRYEGDVTVEDMAQAVRFAAGHPDWDNLERVIVDASDVASHAITPQDVVVAAHIGRAGARPGMQVRYALVATRDDLRELCELYADHFALPGWALRIFDDRAAAEAWLGI